MGCRRRPVSRGDIDLRAREMLTVAMLAAMGTAPIQLKFDIRAALNTGVTREQIAEIALQVAVYAAVPAGIMPSLRRRRSSERYNN